MNILPKDLKRLENECAKLVLRVGKYLFNQWTLTHKIVYKDIRDIVTEADIEAEKIIRDGLHIILPEAGFIVEEGKSELKDEYNWVIDPIDGTKNFAYGLPMFFTQIALMKGKIPVLGLVYNPVSKQLFSGSYSNGVTLNGKSISLPHKHPLEKAILNFDTGKILHKDGWKVHLISILAEKCYRIRITAGFLDPYILTGAIDGIFNFVLKDLSLGQDPKHLADITPHIALMTEIGIKTEFITTPNGKILFIAAHENLLNEVVNVINSAGFMF